MFNKKLKDEVASLTVALVKLQQERSLAEGKIAALGEKISNQEIVIDTQLKTIQLQKEEIAKLTKDIPNLKESAEFLEILKASGGAILSVNRIDPNSIFLRGG